MNTTTPPNTNEIQASQSETAGSKQARSKGRVSGVDHTPTDLPATTHAAALLPPNASGASDAPQATSVQEVVPVNFVPLTDGTSETEGQAEIPMANVLADQPRTDRSSSEGAGRNAVDDTDIDRDEDLPDRNEEETVELLDTLPVPMHVTTAYGPNARAASVLYDELWRVIQQCQKLHSSHTTEGYRAEWQQVAVAAIAGQNNADFKVVQRIIERRGLNLNRSTNQDWLVRAYAAREDWDNRRPGDRAKASVWAQATKNLVEILRTEASEARDGRLFTARDADVLEVMRLIKAKGGIKKLKDWQPSEDDDTAKKKGGARKFKIVLDPDAVASERERRANEGLGAEDTATLIISGPDGREKLRIDAGALPSSTRKELADRQPGNPEIEALGAAFALGVACVIPEGKEARRHRLVRGATIVISTTNMAASVVVKFRPTPDAAELLLIGERSGDLWMRPNDGPAIEGYLAPASNRVAFSLTAAYRADATGRQTAVLWTLSSDMNEARRVETDRCNLPPAAAFSPKQDGIPLDVAEERFRPTFSAVIDYMIDFDALWADYGRLTHAEQLYTIRAPVLPVHGLPLPAELRPEDLDCLATSSRLSRHPKLLLSAGVIAEGEPQRLALPMHNMVGNRPRDASTYVTGDSGGFQVLTKGLPVDNRTRAYVLQWAELWCDAAPPLDVPSAAVDEPASRYFGKFDLALKDTEESHDFVAMHSSARSSMVKMLVLQGQNSQQARRWYERLVRQKRYRWPGIAWGGNRRKNLVHVGRTVLDMWADGVLDGLRHLHVLGYANIGFAVCLTALKRALEELLGRPVLVTFDVSTAFRYAYIDHSAILGVDWDGRWPTLKSLQLGHHSTGQDALMRAPLLGSALGALGVTVADLKRRGHPNYIAWDEHGKLLLCAHNRDAMANAFILANQVADIEDNGGTLDILSLRPGRISLDIKKARFVLRNLFRFDDPLREIAFFSRELSIFKVEETAEDRT